MSTTKAITALETAINDAATGWTGLDWATDAPASKSERRAVEHDAGVAADYGRQALALAKVGDWASAVEQLEHAERIEREYGDSPMWRPALDLARKIAAVMTPGAKVSGPGEDDVGRVVAVHGDSVECRWHDGRTGTYHYSQLAA